LKFSPSGFSLLKVDLKDISVRPTALSHTPPNPQRFFQQLNRLHQITPIHVNQRKVIQRSCQILLVNWRSTSPNPQRFLMTLDRIIQILFPTVNIPNVIQRISQIDGIGC
jgi:hypothetical protein